MRLKDLRINQVPFYYSNYIGKIEETDEDGNLTGDVIETYTVPEKVNARVSPANGESQLSPFGADLVYDKQISTVVKLPINESSRLWIDVVPNILEDGTCLTEPDYICVGVANDLQQNVWAVRRVRNGNQTQT